jgi:hypothetical protein
VALSGPYDDFPSRPQAGYLGQRQARQRHHACVLGFFEAEARPRYLLVPSGSGFPCLYDFS